MSFSVFDAFCNNVSALKKQSAFLGDQGLEIGLDAFSLKRRQFQVRPVVSKCDYRVGIGERECPVSCIDCEGAPHCLNRNEPLHSPLAALFFPGESKGYVAMA